MSNTDPKIYFENTDDPAGQAMFDARVNSAVLADWIVANVADTKYRVKALNSLRRVEADVIEAIVFDLTI